MTENEIRIARALERIATALEPHPEPKRCEPTFYDLLADICEQLHESSHEGALARISACLFDINDAICGGDSNKYPIADSLKEIAKR